MIPEIDTVEIGDCLVYDTYSVEEYVAKLQDKIAKLQAQLEERDCRYVISRSDGFYLRSLQPRRYGRGNSQERSKVKDNAACLSYEKATEVISFLERNRMPSDTAMFQAAKVLPKDGATLTPEAPNVGGGLSYGPRMLF